MGLVDGNGGSYTAYCTSKQTWEKLRGTIKSLKSVSNGVVSCWANLDIDLNRNSWENITNRSAINGLNVCLMGVICYNLGEGTATGVL